MGPQAYKAGALNPVSAAWGTWEYIIITAVSPLKRF